MPNFTVTVTTGSMIAKECMKGGKMGTFKEHQSFNEHTGRTYFQARRDSDWPSKDVCYASGPIATAWKDISTPHFKKVLSPNFYCYFLPRNSCVYNYMSE